MRKTVFLALAIGYCLSGKAGNFDSLRIDTNDSSFIIEKLTFRNMTAVLLLKNNEKITMAPDKIKSYSKNGIMYKRLPLYVNGKCTHQFVFMELVKNQGDLNLYKYCIWSYNPYFKLNNFLLYDGDKLVMEFDESSHP